MAQEARDLFACLDDGRGGSGGNWFHDPRVAVEPLCEGGGASQELMTENEKATTKKAIVGHLPLRLSSAPTLDITLAHELTEIAAFNDATRGEKEQQGDGKKVTSE